MVKKKSMVDSIPTYIYVEMWYKSCVEVAKQSSLK